MSKTSRRGRGVSQETPQREAWILGQPSLGKFLDFVEEMVIGGDAMNQSRLVEQWGAANDIYLGLEKSEKSIADKVGIRKLPAALNSRAEAIRADARYRRAYSVLPTRFAMVELDKLIVSQLHVNLTHAEAAQASLGPNPSPEAIFDFCLPLSPPDAPLHVRQLESDRYMMWSPSSDIRFHEAKLFSPHQLVGHDAIGPVGMTLGLIVGFGSNFLNVFEADNRLLLHNGHHRAYALRSAGVKYAPCLIQTVSHVEELNVVASREVRNSPGHYFNSPRPPLLKDFFDERLRTILPVPKITRVIEISFDVKDYEVKDFP